VSDDNHAAHSNQNEAWKQKEILAAYQVMADAKVPITPAKLATRAVTGYPTALRWLKIHHPELLASVAPVVVAPVAPIVAPEPKPAPPETVQKQPDPAPKKRVTAKANASKLLPKPLRTPPKSAVRSSKGLFEEGRSHPLATFL
jgi:hypothetical protein